MHRIDSPGATAGNLFTEGNPSLSIPATEVSDDWLNDVQEELATVIETAGITLQKGTQNQLLNAINALIGLGGTQIKLDPLLNNTVDQVITNLIFDKASVKAAFVVYDVHRETDTSNEQETGVLLITHDSEDDLWRISPIISAFDDAGLTFAINATGQVRVSTDDLTGANYAGQFRASAIFKLNL